MTEAGIVPGIKVDAGAKDMAGHPGEKITEGLDGLRERLSEYRQMGARFAKWRAVITIGEGIPSHGCLEANAHALARYAALCQETGLVPIVEPEVLMDGDHTLEQCARITEAALHSVVSQLYRHRVLFEGMILKPNMVLPGKDCPKQAGVEEVADATVTCLLRSVPGAVPGVAFLSGGQGSELASARLNAMNFRWRSKMPWVLTFSYSRAIQQLALDTWKGEEINVVAAQKALYHRAQCNSMARPRGVSPGDGETLTMGLVLYFLRHGETTSSQTGGYCGTLDPDLTPAGYEMAQDFAAAYKDLAWQAVFCSPLKRAVATAQPLCEAVGLTPQLRDGLKEIAYGQWEGKTPEEVNREFHDEYVSWLADPGWFGPTGGERGVDIARRSLIVLDEITRTYPDGNILVVSHKATTRIMLCFLLGIDVGRYRDRLSLTVAALSIVEMTKQGPLLKVLGDRTHLRESLRGRPGT